MRERIIVILLAIDIGLMVVMMMKRASKPEQMQCVTLRSIDDQVVRVCSTDTLDVTARRPAPDEQMLPGYQWTR
jgi:hypothetical protein